MALRLITDATAEPVTRDELKLFLRIETTAITEDDLLESHIKTARRLAENKMRRACLPQKWHLTLKGFDSEIVLPRAPLGAASTDVTITYLDQTSGHSTTLSSTVYVVDAKSEPGRVKLGYNQSWPNVYDHPNAVTIEFNCGYATGECPEEIKQWIKMRAANMYEYREPTIMGGNLNEQRRGYVDGLLDPYVLIEVNP